MARCVFPQHGINEGSRETQMLERPCHRWITRAWAFLQAGREREIAALALRPLHLLDGSGCGAAIDALPNEIADQPSIAARLSAAFNVKLREKPVIEKPVALAALNAFANGTIVETFTLETLP
jgi:hypothetical protein